LPTPGKVFTFPAARTTTPAPKTVEETAIEIADEDEAPLELTAEEEEGDELLLGDDDILTTPVGKPPIAPPTDEETADEAPAATTTGGTLFERMSNIARGAPQAQLGEDDEAAEPGFKQPIDIPRFLNRQNNQ
jgi:cell division protein FtsZ